MSQYTLEDARKDIEALNSERIAQMNRLMATEALLKAILAELDLTTLEVLEERYDLRVIAAMQNLEPKMQREHLWTHYLDKIREVIALRSKNSSG